jgi:hypothetical protein
MPRNVRTWPSLLKVPWTLPRSVATESSLLARAAGADNKTAQAPAARNRIRLRSRMVSDISFELFEPNSVHPPATD